MDAGKPDCSCAILYQDSAVVVCIKPPEIDSQEGMPALLSEKVGALPRCVHRLDRGVGGVMVYALSPAAAAALSRAIEAGSMEKTYLAVCAGCPPPEGELRDLLYHDSGKNKSFVVKRLRRGVREAVLRYKVLDAREGCSLIAVRLLTGRTHQIRVQFASRGMPLLGDRKYGGGHSAGGVALWSHALSFPRPDGGGTLRFSAPPPEAAPWDLFRKEVYHDAEFQTGAVL